MKRLIVAVLLFGWLGWGVFYRAWAQENHNYLVVNGDLLDDTVGPYYFIAQGESQTAYARADLFADSLEAELTTEAERLSLRLDQNTVVIATSRDLAAGLVKRADVLRVNGETVASPMALVVGEHTYLPVKPVAEGLGATVDWDPAILNLYVDYDPPVAEPVEEPVEDPAENPMAENPTEGRDVQSSLRGGDPLSRPSTGIHDGYTRVALTLPPEATFDVSVDESHMMIEIAGANAVPYDEMLEDAHLKAMRYAPTAGGVALIVETRHTLTADGRGYSLGLLPADAERDRPRLYVDFGPDRRGERADVLGELPSADTDPLANVREPRGGTYTVVLDPGHGGNDPGAQGYVSEAVVVLQIAERVRVHLEARGVEVIMTRSGPNHLHAHKVEDLLARANMASTEQNAFVSIHANSATSSSAQGIETWVFGQPLNEAMRQAAVRENGGGAIGRIVTDEALAYANSILGADIAEAQLEYSSQLATLVQGQLIGATRATDRGVKQAPFSVLLHARIPAILIEVGFVRNPSEGPRLGTAEYQETLASAIAEALLEWFSQGSSLVNRGE